MLQRWKEDIFFDEHNRPYIQHVTNDSGKWVMADDAQIKINRLRSIISEMVGKAEQGLITGDSLIFNWHQFVHNARQALEEE